MVSLLEGDARIAACQPSMQQFNHHEQYEYAGAAGGWLDCLGYPFAMGRIFEHCEKVEGQFETPVPIFWASGAALFIRSKVFWEVNGLDESFFAHQEEIDLCWRIQWAGYSIYSCPGSVVYHVGGGTLPKGHSRKTFLNFRNNLRMLWKNLPWWRSFPVLAIRFALDAVFAWYSMLKGDAVSFGAVAKAHGSFLLWLFSKKPRQWYPVKKNEDWQGYYKGSVLWKYHVERKNKFLEIVKNFR
jgi:GT2 family glycosyltransferase